MATAVFVPKAPAVVEWPLVASVAVTTSSTTTDFQVDSFSEIEISCFVTALTGTASPNTFDFYVQKRLADGLTYDDVAHFAQVTTSTNVQTLSFIQGGENINVQKNQTLAANTVLVLNSGGWWRLAWQPAIGSTATFSAAGTFYQ